MSDIIDFDAERRKREEQPDPELRNVDENGVEWFTFSVDFVHGGKNIGFHIWATSFEDARERVESIKRTAEVSGQVFAIIPD